MTEMKISGYMENAKRRLEIRDLAKRMFDKYAIYKDNPISWTIWKIAFNVALKPQFTSQEDQSLHKKELISKKDSIGRKIPKKDIEYFKKMEKSKK